MNLASRAIFANTGWLLGDKVLRMGVGLIVSVWIARHLGPESFGALSYAAALVTIFGVVATLGLNGVVVRDLTKDAGGAAQTLGTSFALQLSLGTLSFLLCILTVYWLRPDDKQALLLVAILSLPLPFKAAETVKYWFESQIRSRSAVLAEGVAFALSSGLRVCLLLGGASVVAFAWVAAIEIILSALLLLAIYSRSEGRIRTWQVRGTRAKTLLRESAPLALSGLAVILYMKLDQIIVGEMLGASAVGHYSAGVRLIEMWYAVPVSIIVSAYPAVIRAMSEGLDVYQAKLQRLYDVVVALSVAIALPVSIFSGPIVELAFGSEYRDSASVLAIYAWVIVFASLSVASGRWMIDQGLGLLALRRNILGLVANVLLNFALIPLMGLEGSALATLLAFIVATYLSDCLSPQTRPAFIQKSRSLLFIWLFRKVGAV